MGVTEPGPDELARLAREALIRGRALPGKRGLPALDEAITLAERSIYDRNQLFREKLARHERPSWLFAAPREEDVPALITYAEALFEWSHRHGTPTLLDEQDRIREAAWRAWRLDRSAFHGAADRLLALLDCTLPVGSGANWILSQEHFEAARVEGPGYLPNLLDYAECYAWKLREDQLYLHLLDEIVQANPTAIPGEAAANLAAQARAAELRRAYRPDP